MKKELLIAALIVVLLIVGLSGCIGETDNKKTENSSTDELSTEESRFVGTWESIGWTITFFSDGKYTSGADLKVWELKDGKLLLYTNYPESAATFDFVFSDNDTMLTLISLSGPNVGKEWVFTKQ